MLRSFYRSHKNNLFFLLGLAVFTGLNVFSAATMELHFDEAYYWLYSQYPALGYFDHPPMISWLVFVGTRLFNNELGVRLLAILLSATALVFLWKMVKHYSANALLFWCLIYSILLIHPYCFIATPDTPLLSFAIIFFYFFRKYLEKNSFQNIVLVAISLALMLYSKYHAFLVVLFVIVANFKLFKKGSFWLIAAMVLIYFLPHIVWQIDHRFPSLTYHLIDSHKTAYSPSVTLNFLLSVVALSGPWLGWLLLFVLFTLKPENEWEKSLKYTGVGILVFFFLATFAGDFEAHWVLLAMIPLFILTYKVVAHNQKWQQWVKISGISGFLLLLVVRILMVTPLAEKITPLKMFSGNGEKYEQIKKHIGDVPVVFQDNWIEASRYAWYTRDKNVACLNSAFYRKNQFDIFDNDEKLTGQNVYVLTGDSTLFDAATMLKTSRNTYYVKCIDNFRSYYNTGIERPVFTVNGGRLAFSTNINNTYADTLKIGQAFRVNAAFQLYSRTGNQWVLKRSAFIDSLQVPPHEAVCAGGDFGTYEPGKHDFFVLKIGALKPVPGCYRVEIKE
ncbi:MAG: glycosyltransferase family 39 protein [Prolixibacteraceae bacterium]|nr:glycosyltransferase family 39 protein [Prolixibacteraceae bacterium]